MCTAITFKTRDSYFGRNLDYEQNFGESIAICPRNFPFTFTNGEKLDKHFAILGVALINENYPLFFDAMNEKGLGMAGLNFVHNAHYFKNKEDKINVAQFEFIPFILSQASSVREARELLKNINITDTPFMGKIPPSELHYLLSDGVNSLTIEQTIDGLHVYENPLGVLTNNPPFPTQLFLLNQYMSLSNKNPENKFNKSVSLETYSRGMGAIGLPGDLSSTSRFAKVAFTKNFSLCNNDENSSVSQFFHILNSVEQQRGAAEVNEGEFEITQYATCYNLNKKICYYRTYDKWGISGIKLDEKYLNETKLISYPMRAKEEYKIEN